MFTNRPFTNPPLTDVSTSRSWIHSEPESYVWGCTRHVAGYELTTITRPVYHCVLQTEPSNDSPPDDVTFHASNSLVELQERMRTFNHAMDVWHSYWTPEFTKGRDATLITLLYAVHPRLPYLC